MNEDWTPTPDQEKALGLWRKLHDECPLSDLKGYELWMLHRAHELYRSGELTGEQFAIFMDEVVCW